MLESDWIEYKCKSGQPIFLCNKVTGVHKWPPGFDDVSSEKRIIYAKQVKHRKLQVIATQTDDNGWGKGCTSMDINTDLVQLTETKPSVDAQQPLNIGQCQENNFDKKQEESLVCEDNGEDDWIKYRCQLGQTIFLYNKVTGEHKWPRGYNDFQSSLEENVIHGQPVHIKELRNIATQTDDYGCNNVCTKPLLNHTAETVLQPQLSVGSNYNLDEEGHVENDDIDIENAVDSHGPQSSTQPTDISEVEHEIPDEDEIDMMLRVLEEMEFPPVDNVAEKGSESSEKNNENSNDEIAQTENEESDSQHIEDETSTSRRVEKHMHRNVKIFGCSCCQKNFDSKEILREHVKSHTKKRPFKCCTCEKMFLNNAHLKRHRRIHTGEKPFECSYCKKKFSTSCVLKIHIRTHTKEKPFECSYCKKSFARSCDLKEHTATHSEEKPFKCSHCGKKFSSRRNLRSHLRTHTKQNERPFECSRCKKRFVLNCKLKQHLKKTYE